MFVNEIFGPKKYDKNKRTSRSQLPADQRSRRASGEEGVEESDGANEVSGIIFAEYISGIAYRLLQVFLAAGVVLISREICFYVYDKTNDGGAALLCAFMFIGVVIYVFLPRLKEKKGGRERRW